MKKVLKLSPYLSWVLIAAFVLNTPLTIMAVDQKQQALSSTQIKDLNEFVANYLEARQLYKMRKAEKAPLQEIKRLEDWMSMFKNRATEVGIEKPFLVAIRILDAPLDSRGNTALHLLAERGDLATVAALPWLGIHLDAKNRQGSTPLHLAVKKGHTAMVQELLNRTADSGAKDDQGNMALHLAAQGGHLATAKAAFLGGDISDKNKQGSTALHIAAKKGDLAMVKFLLDSGAAIGAKDNKDNTPLHFAVQGGRSAVVTELLNRGANRNVRNKKGKTPFDLPRAEVIRRVQQYKSQRPVQSKN